MIDKADAIALVQARIATFEPLVEGDCWEVFADRTLERGFGWVVFYGSHLYRKTGRAEYALAGNAPFIVNRRTGEVVVTGTVRPIENYLAEYEAKSLL
jgi:hypothetical protein